MPRAGPNSTARGHAHLRWAGRYSADGEFHRAVAHVRQAMKYGVGAASFESRAPYPTVQGGLAPGGAQVYWHQPPDPKLGQNGTDLNGLTARHALFSAQTPNSSLPGHADPVDLAHAAWLAEQAEQAKRANQKAVAQQETARRYAVQNAEKALRKEAKQREHARRKLAKQAELHEQKR